MHKCITLSNGYIPVPYSSYQYLAEALNIPSGWLNSNGLHSGLYSYHCICVLLHTVQLFIVYCSL